MVGGVTVLKQWVERGDEEPHWFGRTHRYTQWRGWRILRRRGRSGKRPLGQAAEARLRLSSGSAEFTGASSRWESVALNSSTSACSSFLRALEMGKCSSVSSGVGQGVVM